MRQQHPAHAARRAVALTIAGSDSGGGAGIQADLKTFTALDVFGTSALTCITAQNPERVSAIEALSPSLVAEQIRAVTQAFPVAAAKTGMLYSAAIIRAVADPLIQELLPVLVVDPVMVAASGDRLLQPDAIEALTRDLLPLARVVTPNVHEAEILCGYAITNETELRTAAREIGLRYDTACVVKGGHLSGEDVVDVLFDEGQENLYRGPRVAAAQSHGCGCTFSAALTAFLARGLLLPDAVAAAKQHVAGAIEHAVSAGLHRPLNFSWNASSGSPS